VPTSPPPSPPLLLPSFQEALVLEKNATNPVVVYSKTYCPYCSEVKALFASLSVPAKVVELDALPDVAAAVKAVTGRGTVPQVFVGGVHVGGCDDTVAANASGELGRLLKAAGVSLGA
jgi:glutaredoxin